MSRSQTSGSLSLRRILRGALTLAVLLVVAFAVGQLMLASHVPSETRHLIAGVAAIAAAVVAFGRSGDR